MIDIKDKKDCCGCHACATICAKHCITMHPDEEGFLYPIVNKDACTDCGLCEKVCPVINQCEPRLPIKVYAAKNKNEEIRRQSSSGGIFTLFAEKVIKEGGVVFGARFDDEWNVIHSWTDTIEGIAAFRGSKYVQSTIGNTYREAREFLKQGRKVLFTGTPCQIAGLKKFLRKEYDNLLTIDIVCHGVPSPLVWQKYLDNVRSQLCVRRKIDSFSMDEIPVITGISFRDKTTGWKKYGFRIRYVSSTMAKNMPYSSTLNEKEFSEVHIDNLFMKVFLKDLCNRPSCINCPAKQGKSYSDITIADYWGIDKHHLDMDDDKGVSLVLVYNPISNEKFSHLDSTYIETSYAEAFEGNRSLEYSIKENKYIPFFWKSFYKTGFTEKNINKVVNHTLNYKTRVKNIIKKLFQAIFPKPIYIFMLNKLYKKH